MEKSYLARLFKKSVSLLGYGKSNEAVFDYLSKNGIVPIIRNEREIPLPNGAHGIFDKDYDAACEDVVFRSPGVRGTRIKEGAEVFTDVSFFLERLKAFKIGITGSDGKTTTTVLIHKILEKDEKRSHLVGNIGIPIASVVDDVLSGDFLVAELSSFQLFDYEPNLDIAVVTSISENHLDWHKSFSEYVCAKRNIVKNARKRVIYYDMPYRDSFTFENTTFFSLNDCSPYLDSSCSFVYLKDGFVFYNEKRLFKADVVKLRGNHGLLNAMAAVASLYGLVSLDSVASVLSTYEGERHRAEHVATINGIKFINSSVDSTPTRTKTTLSSFPLDKTVVILGGYDKNLDYTPLKDIANEILAAVVFGSNREKIVRALTGACRVILVNDINEATKTAYYESAKNGYVILSPASASFDMFENYKDRAEKFIDAVRGLKNGEN